jgi:hypothetical protein
LTNKQKQFWRAARYVINNQRNRSSVSNMLQRFKWRPLANRRKDARLMMMYTIDREPSVRQDFTYETPPRYARNDYATYQGMYEHNLCSLRYLCTFSYSKNNSKFTRSLLKIYVFDLSKTFLSMKVKYVYVTQNRKYTGGAVQEKKVWNTVRVISYQFDLYINVISLLCNPNGTLFQTCLILYVWLK